MAQSPATVDLDDRLQGLERLICQQHDNLQLLIRELLLQQTKVLDVRLQEVAEKIALGKQKGAVHDEFGIHAAIGSSHIGLGHSMIPPETDSKKQTQAMESCQQQELPLARGSESQSSFRPSGQIKKSVNKLVHLEKKVENDIHHWLIHHHIFLAVVRFSILANALQMGLQVDLNFGQWNTCWRLLDNVFTAVFALEMIMSIVCLGLSYFYDRWHLLDFLVACSSIIDTWILWIAFGDEDGYVILRVFQFLRLLRMIKILKMRRELYILMTGIANSAELMLWVVVLLFLIIYTAAILCVDVVGSSSLAGQYAEVKFDNVYHFGTLLSAMITLFNISILDGWSSIIWPIKNVQPFMVPLFMMFLVITAFALMNALIGIIVEQTSLAMKRAEELAGIAKREEKLRCVTELVHLVGQIDENQDTIITEEEMKNAWDRPALKQILQGIDLPSGFSGTDLHMMLDENGSGTLPIEHFIDGMFQLIYSNEFQAQCLAKLSVSKIMKCVFELRQDTLAQMQFISHQMDVMHKCMRSGLQPLLGSKWL